MKCSKYGSDISITDKVCPRCGVDIGANEENQILEDISRYDSRCGDVFESSISDFAAQISSTQTWVLIFYFVIGLLRSVMSSFVLTGKYYPETEFSFSAFAANMLPYIGHMLVIFWCIPDRNLHAESVGDHRRSYWQHLVCQAERIYPPEAGRVREVISCKLNMDL